MTRVICCNRFLSQSVLSPEWPVGCLCCHDNYLIVSSGLHQLTILEWIDDEDGGQQLQQCGQLVTGLPVIQVRCCSKSGLLVALCSAESTDRGASGGTVCQAYLNWRFEPTTPPVNGCPWRFNFSDHRRANLIRVDANRVAIAEARTVSIYKLIIGLNKSDGFRDSSFELMTVLQMDFVLTQLEIINSNYPAEPTLLAAAANRILLLQLRPRPRLLMNDDEGCTSWDDDSSGGNVFSLFDFDDLELSSAMDAKEMGQPGKAIQLDSKPTETLFPDTKPVCRVSFSQPAQLAVKTWLLKTVSLQGDERLHSLALWHFDSENLMAFFSTNCQGFIFCLNSAENRIEKLMELRYNSVVFSAVIGADGLLHTMSTDLVESYTTHQPLCRLSSSIASSAANMGSDSSNIAGSSAVLSAVPNLLIGSQMFPGIVTVAAHSSGLLLVSSAAEAEDPATGGHLLSTLYTLVFESAANLVEDLIDKCLEFKMDSEDIYLHLASEAAFLLQTAKSAENASEAQKQKVLEFCANLIKEQPDDCIAARLMLDYLHPDLGAFLSAVSLDAAKLLQSSSLVGYIRDGLLCSADFSLPEHQSAVWPCLEQLLRALLARESAPNNATLLIRLVALLPSNGPTLSRLCSHELPRLNPGTLLRCLAAFAARVEYNPDANDDATINTTADDGSSIFSLSEAEICHSLPSLTELMPLDHFSPFFQKLFTHKPLSVCAAMESMDRFDWQFASQLPWPLSVYFVEVRWLQQIIDDATDTSAEIDAANEAEDEEQFKRRSELLVELLSKAVEKCNDGGAAGGGRGCKLPIDVSLSTPEGLLKRLLSLLYNLPGMESRRCCCLAFVAQRILLLLWLRPSHPPPAAFDTLCSRLRSADPTLALCVSQAPLLIGCQELTNPEHRAQRLIPILRLDDTCWATRRRLIGCLRLEPADWLALMQAAHSQSDRDAVRSLASHFADQLTLDSLLDGSSNDAQLLFRCAGREALRNQRDELTTLLATQLAE